MCVYLLVNLVYFRAMPLSEIGASARIGEEATTALLGPTAGRLLAAAVLVSVFGCLSSAIIGASRLGLPMSEDAPAFRWMSRIHPRYKTPDGRDRHARRLVDAARPVGQLRATVSYSLFSSIIFHVITGLALFHLRRQRPNTPRPYRVVGYPWVPALVRGGDDGTRPQHALRAAASVTTRCRTGGARRAILSMAPDAHCALSSGGGSGRDVATGSSARATTSSAQWTGPRLESVTLAPKSTAAMPERPGPFSVIVSVEACITSAMAHAASNRPDRAQGAHNMKPKNTICLWFDKDAHEAARFYAATFPDSKVTAVHKAPGDYPGGKKGDVLTVEFTVLGIPCLGLNGGPEFKHSEAFSFQVATDNQEETDRYWNAIVGNGGKESQCGWCKDRWGLSWQITPRVLTDALAAGGGEAKRAFEAMMPMKKIDIANIEAARRG